MSLNTLRLRSPADVVSAIPYLIGFHPADSVVVLVCDGAQGTCAMRLDLGAHETLLEHIADLVARRTPDAVILAGYGEAGRVTPAIERLRGHLRTRDVPLRDALRVEDGRFWSYLCSDLACCPAEGTYVDVATNPATVAAIAAGLVALPDRRELERTLAPSGGETMRDALARAKSDFATWGEREKESDPRPGPAPDAGVGAGPGAGTPAGPGVGQVAGSGAATVAGSGADGVSARMVMEGVPLVRRVIDQVCAGADLPSLDETAWLGLLLTSLRVRDEAWVRMNEQDLKAHIRLWRNVLTRLPEEYAAAPACLLSFAAWRSGDGALANIALDRALAADPHYTMARLLQELFVSGLPPWSLRMDLTPDELDETG
jgi:Domain of unknown function (DUF4192)